MADITMTSASRPVQDTILLPRAAYPEEVGIPSDAVRELIRAIDETGFRYHSIMILRGGKVAAECHRYPFSPRTPHILYSISKSVTAVAVGLAIQEGIMTLDTTIAEVFPEYVPQENAEKFSRITVRHLLSMTSGIFPSYFANKTKGEWIRQYAASKWYAEPGEEFKYINENPYMLCSMIRRLTGQTVTEFLQPRLWDPLGIRTPYWETDETGTESGGWGLFLTPEGFAKFTLMIHQGGMFNGKRILNEEFVREATSPQITTNREPPERTSYGYCFWLFNEDEYQSAGVFGQVGYARKDIDIAVVITAGDMHSELVIDPIRAMCAEIKETTLPAPEDPDALRNELNALVLDVLPETSLRSDVEKDIDDKILWFSKTLPANLLGFPPTVLPLMAVYMTKDRAGNMDRFQFRFFDDYALFQWREGDEVCCVRLGMDGKYRASRVTLAGTRYTIYGAAFWEDEQTLQVNIRPVESVGIRYLTFRFHGKKVDVSTRSDPALDEVLEDLRFTVDEMMHTRAGRSIGGKLFDAITKIVEPTMHGEILERAEPKLTDEAVADDLTAEETVVDDNAPTAEDEPMPVQTDDEEPQTT